MTELEKSADSRGGRWIYLDVCRVFTIYLVVLLHVVATQWHVDPIGSTDWTILSVYFSVPRVAIPVFFMMSGAIFLGPERVVPLRTLYGKYILRFVVALLFWSTLYHLIVVYAWNGESAWEGFYFRRLLSQVLGGHPYQHWFLFAIIAMYMLMPLLKCIAKDKTATRYFLVLWLLWELGLFNINLLYTFFPNMNPIVAGWIGEVVDMANRIPPRMVLGLHGYMVLGYYLHAYPPGDRARRIWQAAGVAGTVFTVVATYHLSVRENTRMETLYSLNSLAIAAGAVAFFITARSLFPGRTERRSGLLVTLGAYSFGIYLVHDFFLIYLRDKGFTPGLFPRVISPIVVSVAVYFLSVIAVHIIRKIPVVRDYIT